jgi:hypothetical protein
MTEKGQKGDIADLVPYNRGRRLRRPHLLRRRRVGHPFYVIARGGDRRPPNRMSIVGKEVGMRIMTVAFALGTTLALCSPEASIAAAHAKPRIVHEPRRIFIVAPVVTPEPYWDSNIVPRYRYRPEDDRVDPYGPPVVPVIRYGNQEIFLPAWYW